MSEPWTIVGFAEAVLGMKLYDWQKEVLYALQPLQSRVTLRAVNESGKTSIVAVAAVLWHMSLFANSKTVCTSGVWRQVVEQLWPHIARYGNAMGWECTQKTADSPNGSRAIGFSTSEEGKFEGFHALDHLTSPLLIIADEAKTIDPSIFNGIERCRPTRLLVMSSPGAPTGGFYEVCQDQRFVHFKVTAFECPHLGQAKADEIATAKGRESLLYKSMILAEWMADPNQLFCMTRRAIDRCLGANVPATVGGLLAGIDIAHAESGNENVLAVKHGNIIELDDCFVGSGNANAIVDRFISRLDRRRINPQAVWIDGDGMGSIYADIFRAKGWNINLWSGQAKANDPSFYANRSSEAWMEFARNIENCTLKIPNDTELIKQLTSREYKIEKGRIKLVPKPYHSPDRADAMVMVNSIRALQPIQAMEPMSAHESLSHPEPSLSDVFNAGVSRGRYNDYLDILPQGWNVGS